MDGSIRYAVAIALGPVGSFISAGRRSRDLWYGSRLLSELTRQVAISLRRGREVQFWTPRRESLDPRTLLPQRFRPGENEMIEAEAAPERSFFDVTGQHPHEGPVISNKIRAIIRVGGEADIQEILRDAEMEARQWLVDQLGEVKKKEEPGGEGAV